ncbi:hypothetical protein BDN72DRAFT_905978 [Pluteus cervinus]|uniref:Uncharacterized protein n=1 Tax=Pluteus cervinus TaxID=181527 RepID=A0ACD3A373_9AGAR|nr:hypothetical protein BDN72DRAFT_905978 [Pluteus cervinus]
MNSLKISLSPQKKIDNRLHRTTTLFYTISHPNLTHFLPTLSNAKALGNKATKQTQTKLPGFNEARSRGRSKAYARAVHSEFSKLWPEREELYPTEPGAPKCVLKPRQERKVQKLIEARFGQIYSWLQRNSNKRGRTTGRAVKVLMRGHRKRRRAPQASEAYLRLYPNKVNAHYEDRKGDAKMTNGARLNLLRKIATELMATESEEVLTKVAKKQQEMRDARDAETNAQVDNDLQKSALQEYVEEMPALLKLILHDIRRSCPRWGFLVVAAGPMPETDTINIFDVYDGPENLQGYGFSDVDVNFVNVCQAMGQFMQDCHEEYLLQKEATAALDSGIKMPGTPLRSDVSDDEEDEDIPQPSHSPISQGKITAKPVSTTPGQKANDISSASPSPRPIPRPVPRRVGRLPAVDSDDDDDDEPIVAVPKKTARHPLEVMALGSDMSSGEEDEEEAQWEDEEEWNGFNDTAEWGGIGGKSEADSKPQAPSESDDESSSDESDDDAPFPAVKKVRDAMGGVKESNDDDDDMGQSGQTKSTNHPTSPPQAVPIKLNPQPPQLTPTQVAPRVQKPTPQEDATAAAAAKRDLTTKKRLETRAQNKAMKDAAEKAAKEAVEKAAKEATKEKAAKAKGSTKTGDDPSSNLQAVTPTDPTTSHLPGATVNPVPTPATSLTPPETVLKTPVASSTTGSRAPIPQPPPPHAKKGRKAKAVPSVSQTPVETSTPPEPQPTVLSGTKRKRAPADGPQDNLPAPLETVDTASVPPSIAAGTDTPNPVPPPAKKGKKARTAPLADSTSPPPTSPFPPQLTASNSVKRKHDTVDSVLDNVPDPSTETAKRPKRQVQAPTPADAITSFAGRALRNRK